VNQQASQVTNSQFLGVSLASPADGWAVGTFDDENAVGHPLVEHWDGTMWALGHAPQPAGRDAQLAGVDELSPSDVWAVGYTLSAGQSQESLLLEHFNGTQWKTVPFPSQDSACDPGLSDCFLDATAIAASAPGNAWLTGNVSQPNATQHLLAHWNGTSWSLAKTPNRGGEGSLLNAISAVSASDVSAVGQTQQPGPATWPASAACEPWRCEIHRVDERLRLKPPGPGRARPPGSRPRRPRQGRAG
jgi:hypothetical protein